MKQVLKIWLFIFVMFSVQGLLAQVTEHIPSKERGDPRYRRKAQLEGNNIRTTIFNFGHTGRTGAVPIYEETPYEWPKNTGEVYLAQTTIWWGAEVVDANGERQRIVIVDNGRTSDQGKSWNIEPCPGYFNPEANSIANSVDPNTWPPYWPDKMNIAAGSGAEPGWPGSWNGYFGRDKFNADQEIFYRASDDRYDNYLYFPDSTDLTRHGLGILMDVRAMAWSQILVSDVVYLLHFLTNDGTKDLQKFAVTLGVADFVGGDGDSQDDISEYDLLNDIMWSRDADNKAPTFGKDPVGIVGVALLETPGNADDRIDNDGDGEPNGPIVTEEMLKGEGTEEILNNPGDPRNSDGIDNNHNGLVDETIAHIAFGEQVGVSYADHIDNNGNAEEGSPVVTQEMLDKAKTDSYHDPLENETYNWNRWPPNPENDPIQKGKINLIMVDETDIGHAFRDYIDNDGDGEENSPVITQEMIEQAAQDAPYYRYAVPNSDIILYDVKQEDLGKKYADGIDNDGDGAVDEDIDEGIDEMIDERRDDFIDNDGDWNPLLDDVGIDGIAGTNDFGEGDGKPTSGAGTDSPGEPDVDKTDVSETDQIGISASARTPAGGLNLNSDATLWFDFMIPGKFYDPRTVQAGEYDLWVTSGYFPIKAGQREPISVAVILANAKQDDPNGELRKKAVLKKKIRAQETYNNDYQFANAPITPHLTAVPGDNKVTLYWDDLAEQSYDNYIYKIGGNPYDFEGYRIYRATDPAFQDPLEITDAFGTLRFRTPLVQFDKVDGITGLDSVGLDGAHFYLGNDSGLKHVFVDSTAKNGFTYYYAITSYDFGYPAGGILPTECPIRVNLQPDGSVVLGPNVVRVTPEAPAAGYVPPTLGNIEHQEGSSTGKISYEIVDPNKVQDGHVYYITFRDTLKPGKNGKPDTLTTYSYTLIDSTADSVLIKENTHLETDYEQPMVDGFRLHFFNEGQVGLNQALSGWRPPTANIPAFTFQKLTQSVGPEGEFRLNDYEIIFGERGMATSTPGYYEGKFFDAQPVNFKILRLADHSEVDFVFVDLDTAKVGPGIFSAGIDTLFGTITIPYKDVIAFLEPKTVDGRDTLVYTWQFFLSSVPDSTQRIPMAGDTAKIILKKPFLSEDIYRFTAHAGFVEKRKAKVELSKIKVVPNPYVATAAWEPRNPYNSGRGPRSIHFIHLPAKCTIRIFTINGELVRKIEVNNPFDNGTAEWDVLTKDRLAVSYGVYIYHVEAPGIGEKVGKFAIIK